MTPLRLKCPARLSPTIRSGTQLLSQVKCLGPHFLEVIFTKKNHITKRSTIPVIFIFRDDSSWNLSSDNGGGKRTPLQFHWPSALLQGRVETGPFSAEVGFAPPLRRGLSQPCRVDGRSASQNIKDHFWFLHCQNRNFMKISRNLKDSRDLYKKVSMGLCEKA